MTSFLRQAKRKQTPVLLRWFPRDSYASFWHCRSTQTFWNNVSQWTSENLDLTNLIFTPITQALCLGLIDNISNRLLHHFLLIIPRHYTYSCKLRNTIPMVQVYTQLVIRSIEFRNRLPLIIIITQPPLGRNRLLSINQKNNSIYIVN